MTIDLAAAYRRLGAPPNGRVWWEYFAFISMVTGGLLLLDLLTGFTDKLLPHIGTRIAGPYLPYDLRVIVFSGNSMAVVGRFALATAMLWAAMYRPRSALRGLTMMVAACVLNAGFEAVANNAVVHDPAFYRLGLLRWASGFTVLVTGVEFLIHIPALKAAIDADIPEETREAVIPQLRDARDEIRELVSGQAS